MSHVSGSCLGVFLGMFIVKQLEKYRVFEKINNMSWNQSHACENSKDCGKKKKDEAKRRPNDIYEENESEEFIKEL